MASVSDKNINFVVEIIRERMEAIDPKPDQLPDRETIQKKVSKVLVSLLCEESPDHYVTHVATLCEGLPPKGLYLERLWESDANMVYDAFHLLWERLPGEPEDHLQPHLKGIFKEYIACKRNYGSAQIKYAEAHVDVTQWLIKSRRHYPEHLIMTLLALTYWLFSFNCEKYNKKHHKTYNTHLHHFLSDLIVTLLLLKCLLPQSTHQIDITQRVPNFPKFKENIIHLGISPTDAVFQRLVLRQMFKILQIECDKNRKTPQDMAQLVHEHFLQGNWLWAKKGACGILRIVQDQSRYLTLRSPDLRRNFVADKTRREVSKAVKMIQSNIPAYLENGDQQQALDTFRSIMTGIDRSDDGSCLPPLAKNLSTEDIHLINLLHHMIVFAVSEELLGTRCPRINAKAWLELNNGQQFTVFVEDLAREVLDKAKRVDSTKRTRQLYPQIAKLVVSLQQIIAARWYVSEVMMKGISANAEVKQHQEVVFLFLGFRTLLLYLLPQNPYNYGVQRVAQILPNYAKQIRLNLHLHVLD